MDKEKNYEIFLKKLNQFGIDTEILNNRYGELIRDASFTLSNDNGMAYEGSLVDIVLKVLTGYAVRINELLPKEKQVDKSSLVKVCLLHHISKAVRIIKNDNAWEIEKKNLIYKYDDRNRTASVNEYNPDGTLSEQIVYNYTDSGAIDSIAKRDAFTEKQTSMVFRYGTNGVLNEITTYNSDKQVIKRTLLKYDDKGNVNKVSEYDVAEKFGTTVNDLVAMSEFSFDYSGSSADAK